MYKIFFLKAIFTLPFIPSTAFDRIFHSTRHKHSNHPARLLSVNKWYAYSREEHEFCSWTYLCGGTVAVCWNKKKKENRKGLLCEDRQCNGHDVIQIRTLFYKFTRLYEGTGVFKLFTLKSILKNLSFCCFKPECMEIKGLNTSEKYVFANRKWNLCVLTLKIQ